jgi:Zn-dependent protease with chaperone function
MTLGHEMAHVDLKHAIHKVQFLYQSQKIVGNLANLGQPLYATLTAPYEKDNEFEADAVGFDACRKAGWESSKLLSLYEGFIKLEQEQAKGRGDSSAEPATGLENRLGDYLKAHPPTAERLARLKARA